MKSILALLTAFVLFGIALTSTSCKKCSKDEPINRGGDTDNTPSSDTTTSSATIDGNSKAPDGPIPSGDNTTGSDDKKGGGGRATGGVEGGTSSSSGDTDEVPVDGDNTTGSDDKKGGGSRATGGVEGGTSSSSGDTDEVPVDLENKRKAAEKLVRDVAVEYWREASAMKNQGGKAAKAMANWEDGLAWEKMGAVTVTMERVRTNAGKAKAEVKKLNIDRDPVVHALLARLDYYETRAENFRLTEWSRIKFALAMRRPRVNAWAETKWGPESKDLCFEAFWKLGPLRQLVPPAPAELDRDDVNAIVEFVESKNKWWEAGQKASNAADRMRQRAEKAMKDVGFPPFNF